MPPYCLKCGENTKSIILQVSRATNDEIIIIISKCAICSNKKPRFIKNNKQKDY